VLERLSVTAQALSIDHMALRAAAAGELLWVAVRPEMVEISFDEWGPGRLLPKLVHLGEYGEPAIDVRRSPPD
jgi:hypothetical protein